MCHSVTRSLLVAGIVALGGLTACSEPLPQNSGLAMPDQPEVRTITVRETGPPSFSETFVVYANPVAELQQGQAAAPSLAAGSTDVMASRGLPSGLSPGQTTVIDLVNARSTMAVTDPLVDSALSRFSGTVRLLV